MWLLVKERGKFRDNHPHAEADVCATDEHIGEMEKELKELLDIGPGQGQVKGSCKVKAVYSEGWGQYLAKDHGKEHFQAWGNHSLRESDWVKLNKQYRESQNMMYGFDGRSTFKQNILSW